MSNPISNAQDRNIWEGFSGGAGDMFIQEENPFWGMTIDFSKVTPPQTPDCDKYCLLTRASRFPEIGIEYDF